MSHFRCLSAVLLLLLALVAAQDNITDYAPDTGVQCPDTDTNPLIRVFTPQNQSLHPGEIEFVNTRETTVIPDAWKSWLGDGSDIGYNASLLSGNLSRIGLAFSGGGYRAAQFGAGVLSALDARNDSAKAAGTGGLLQVASYFSGLSGGSWLTGSLYLNDWPTIPDLVLGNGKDLSGWILNLNLLLPGGLDILDHDNIAFYGSLVTSVIAKANKGLNTSLTDPWARAISYHFLNQTTKGNFFTNDSAHGAGQLWSEIPSTSAYQQNNAPFPIIVADSRPVGSNFTGTLPLDPIVYEITPLEFGSFDPNLSAMMNLSFAGTPLSNGKPPNNTACVTKFDQAGFVMGTSSNILNSVLDTADNDVKGISFKALNALKNFIIRKLQDIRIRSDDVAVWPNPFQGLEATTFEDSSDTFLQLIDGGSNGEVVPLGPMFVKSRNLDVIVGVDATSNDNNNFPNGDSVLNSARRISTLLQSSHQAFPPLPNSTDDFVAAGLNLRPTFFGCDPTHTPPEYPLVIYLPNSPPLTGKDPVTNTNTFKLDYTSTYTQAFLDQAHANTIGGFTPNSNSPDSNWGKCLQCAAVDRSRLKLSPVLARSDICTKCFQQYCYDPQNPPSKDELPNRKFVVVDPDAESFLKRHRVAIIAGSVGGAVGLLLLICALLMCCKRRAARYRRVLPNDSYAMHTY